ncbi:MAG: proline dehydrogenase family protein [Deltaproteobacteria bacterium]|nr:proline dehydrogenase family protein [Deltaproteobacteria bacterium]
MSLFSRFVVATLPVVPKFLVGKVASRYVAGETLEDALEAVRSLNALGAMATVDILGEEVSQRDRADRAVEEYLTLYDALHREGLDANVSIKPTMVGLKIDPVFFEENVTRLVERASSQNNFLRLDMEDRTCTDATLETYRRVHGKFSNLGVVLQAYMRRTLRDIEELPEENANVRLCKGIYIEPREDAWKGYETVRRNFVAALEKLFRRGVYVGIATHDEYLTCAAVELIDRLEIPQDRYEFQMLLGVDQQLRDILLAEGHRLRVYVPYGQDWYLYSMRRLRENPEVARHVIRATLAGGRSSS